MFKNFISKLSLKYQKFNINKIEGGASKKIFYRISYEQESFIVIDFSLDRKEYYSYLKVYNLLIKINISIPCIIENDDNNLIIISEDFGNYRFDKIINKYLIKDLLKYAVDTLIILNNSTKFDSHLKLPQYNLKIFKDEISELSDYYFPYIKIDGKNAKKDFMHIWLKSFDKINFDFNNFSHKDFNLNNLILIPSLKGHLKCGVIDFQSAFWGESSWDLFSLLEDSRILFDEKFNDYFVDYFYSQTSNKISLEEFRLRFNFLNSSRQTRLLGRWVKLSNELNQKWYLDFISTTKYRLKKSIQLLNNKELMNFYNKYILK